MPIEDLSNILSGSFPNTFEWLSELSNSKEGEIICWNFLRQHKFNLIEPNEFVTFKNSLESYLSNNPDAKERDPKTVFRELRKNKKICLSGQMVVNKGNDSCASKSPKKTVAIEALCRIVSDTTFDKYSGPSLGWNEGPLQHFPHKGSIHYALNSRAGFLWVSKTQDVEKARKNKNTWEDILRKQGRPVQGTKQKVFFYLKYPKNFSPDLVCKPTFIEGGANFEFRLCNTTPLEWNYSIRLDSGDRGFEEAVHCPSGTITVEYVQISVNPEGDQLNIDKLLEKVRI